MSSSAPRRAGWVQPAARIAAVGALAAGVVLGADRLGPVSSGSTAPTDAQRVAATSTTGYCPGDPFADARSADGEDAGTSVDVTGSVAAHAAPEEALTDVVTPSKDPGRITLSGPQGPPSTADEEPTSGPTTESRDELTDPTMVQGTQERAPGMVAGQSFVAGGDQASGLAALPCTAPTADAWLVAGGGEKGRQESLVLTNSGGNAVTARIEALGAKGEDAGRDVVVPAHDRTVVLLDGLGGTDAPQAVHVTSTGGLVVPTIVDRHLAGLTPAGVETVGPTAAPARRQVIPANANGERRGLVLGAPGDEDAVVEVRSVGSDDSRGAKVSTVPAGGVVDVDLPKGTGVHAWVVESDEPVVAAAHVTTRGSDGTKDMAWSTATPAFGTLGGAALPTARSTPRAFLDVTAAEGPARAEVVVQRDGKVSTESIEVLEDHSRSVSVTGAEAVWVRPTKGSVHAAVLLIGSEGEGEPRATSVPVLPSRVAVRDVDVVHER